MRRVVPGLVLTAVTALAAGVLWFSPPSALPERVGPFWTFLVGVWGVLALTLLALTLFRAATRLGAGVQFAVALLVGGPTALTTMALAGRGGGGASSYVAIAWLVAFLVVGAVEMSGRARQTTSSSS